MFKKLLIPVISIFLFSFILAAGYLSYGQEQDKDLSDGQEQNVDLSDVQRSYDLSVLIEKESLSIDEAREKIKDIIASESGSVISTKVSESNLRQTVTFEIPAKNYHSFLNSLKRKIDIIRESLPDIPLEVLEGEGSLELSLYLSVSR